MTVNLSLLQQTQTLISDSEEPSFQSKVLADIPPREIKWLWDQRIPIGCITLLEGDGGQGKSYISAAIASALSSGESLPEDCKKDPANILIFSAEDDPAVVLRPRYEAHGANSALIRVVDDVFTFDERGLRDIEREAQTHKPKLIIIDPIMPYLGRIDSNKATDVRSIMRPLHEIAKKHECAIVMVRHWNKSSFASASQRGSGSVDFRNAARSVLQVMRKNEASYLSVEKSNYAAKAKTLTFEIKERVVWTGVSELTADDLLEQINQERGSKSELDEAKEYLKTELRKGRVSATDINNGARELGISESTMKRARKSLGVKANKLPGENKFYLELPDAPGDEDMRVRVTPNELDPHPPLPGSFEVLV